MTRRFTSEIINEIGPEKDIPAPDVGTDASVMAWIFDTYSMNKGHSVLGVVTGKPLAIGGSLGREEATARGALYCIADALAEGGHGARRAPRRRAGLRQRRLAPRAAARRGGRERGRGLRLERRRCTTPNGLDVPAALAHKARARDARRASPARDAITNEELLLLDCDVLAPCALEQVITRGQRGAGQGADHLRGRERPDHAGRRRDPRGPRRARPPGRARERGRRRRLLLRVGAGPPGVLLEGGRGQRAAERHRHAGVRGDVGDARAAHRRACAWPRTGSPCSASPRRPSRAASIPRRRVVVYTREGCHLCERALEVVDAGRAPATSSASTSAATPSSRRATASGSRWSRSTASAPSPTSSQPDALRAAAARPALTVPGAAAGVRAAECDACVTSDRRKDRAWRIG